MPLKMSPRGQKAGSREDDDLMCLIASGDQKAAKQMVERHLPMLLSLAQAMLGNRAEAEEIAQDAFLKLWKKAVKWQPERALISTWLRRVASNNCIDRLRARRTRTITPMDERSMAPTQQLELEEKHLSLFVNAALDEIPARQKLALVLCHYQGLSQRQAALEMEISEHALESLLARARKSLKEMLSSEWKQLLPDRTQIDGYQQTNGPTRVKK